MGRKRFAEEQQFRDAGEVGMTIIRTRHPYEDIITEPSDIYGPGIGNMLLITSQAESLVDIKIEITARRS